MLYQGLADGLGLALGDVLVEVEETACHGDLGIGTEVGAGAIDDILAVGINDSGVERIIGCPLTNKSMEAVVLARTGGMWHCSTVGSAVISHGAVTARRIMSGCSLAHTEAFLFLTDVTDYTDAKIHL